jgi:hypothetical protein
MKKNNLYTFTGYLVCCEPEYNRIYVCLSNDKFTEEFLQKKRNDDDNTPLKIDGYKTYPSGFFIKYNYQTLYTLKLDGKICTIYDLLNEHINIKAIYKDYNYGGRRGWNLTAAHIYGI